jgi:C4-dicarboxylate transporter DctQ subunit
MTRLIQVWDELEKWFIGTCALLATLGGFYSLIVRKMAMPVSWSEEVIIYFIAWGVFIGISGAARDNQHVAFDLLGTSLSGKKKIVLELSISLLSCLFCVAIAFIGGTLAHDFVISGQVSQSSLRFPLWIAILSVPIGFSLTSLRYLWKIIELSSKLREENRKG